MFYFQYNNKCISTHFWQVMQESLVEMTLTVYTLEHVKYLKTSRWASAPVRRHMLLPHCHQPIGHEEDRWSHLLPCWSLVVLAAGRWLVGDAQGQQLVPSWPQIWWSTTNRAMCTTPPRRQSWLGTVHCSNDRSGCLNHTCDKEVREKSQMLGQ